MAHVLETDRGGVLVRRPDPLERTRRRRFEELVERRERREPLQYLTGVREFYGLEMQVDRRVFIPRPETEGLVDRVLSAGLPEAALVLDLGTGSGCIVVALAASRSDLRMRAVEASAAALELARDNALRHGVAERIEFRQGDLHDLPRSWDDSCDAVVSNPPYVPEAEWEGLQPEVRDWEPREALVAGPSGLEAYRAIAPAAMRLLREGGLLALEVGFGQARAVREILEQAGFHEVEVRPDLNGIERVASGLRPRSGGAP